MTGTATVLDPSLGLLLALRQVPAGVPAVATRRRAGIRRRTRILVALSFTVPVLSGRPSASSPSGRPPRC